MLLMKLFRDTAPTNLSRLSLPFTKLAAATVAHFFQHASLDEIMVCYTMTKNLSWEHPLSFRKFRTFVTTSLEFNLTMGRGHHLFLTTVRTYFKSAIECW